MAKEIIIKLDGTTGASLPNDPVLGRFTLWGKISHGLANMIDRKVIVELTHEQAENLVNSLASALLRHPRCGITPRGIKDDF